MTELATEKQVGMVGYLLSWMKREQLGIPKVMRGRADYSGTILDDVIAKSNGAMVSVLIEKLQNGPDDEIITLLNLLGYFDALDRANAEAAQDSQPSATAMQSA